MATDSIGLSGLLTSQRLLDLAGQNITNANTPGYHRRVASLAAITTGSEVGLGVEITQVRRLIDQTLETAVLRSTYSLQDMTTQLNTLRQVEGNLDIGDGSVNDLLA